MLRVNRNGSISLTINGDIITTMDSIIASEISARDLVIWENQVRKAYYERQKGFWCESNQRSARIYEVSEERLLAYPKATIQSLEEHNKYWETNRDRAIDK